MSNNTLPILPLGSGNFEQIRELGAVYVDKTDLIYNMLQIRMHPVFISKPRRFGKSLLTTTIASWFINGKKYFDGLKIAQYADEQQKCAVMRLDFVRIANTSRPIDKQLANLIIESLSYRFDPQSWIERDDPIELLKEVFTRCPQKSVVLIVDEYDKPLIKRINDKEKFDAAANLISDFFDVVKSYYGTHMRFCLITGILRFSHTSIFSSFNTLIDLSFEHEYASLFGFTREELLSYFSPHLESSAEKYGLSLEKFLDGLTENYDGYCFDRTGEIKVFNPWSILNCLNTVNPGVFKFESFWIDSGYSTSLNNYLKFKEHQSSWPETINDICALFEPQAFDISELRQPSEYLSMDPKILLAETGYLTFKKFGSAMRLVLPNLEVTTSFSKLFLSKFKDLFVDAEGIKLSLTDKRQVLLDALENPDAQELSNCFNHIIGFFASSSRSSIFARETLVRDIIAMFLSLTGFRTQREVEGLMGRPDLIVNYNDSSDWSPKCAVFEFKRLAHSKQNKSSKDSEIKKLIELAKTQVLNKRYLDSVELGVKATSYAVIIDSQDYKISSVTRLNL